MSEMYECPWCKRIDHLSEFRELKQDEIVTCSESEKVYNVYCWDCNFKCNSKECLEFIEEQKKKYPEYRQFTNEEFFG